MKNQGREKMNQVENIIISKHFRSAAFLFI